MEALASRIDLASTPLIAVALMGARAILAGVSLGIFHAVANGAQTALAIAATCRTNAPATQALVDCLVSLGCLRFAEGQYSSEPGVDQWLPAYSRKTTFSGSSHDPVERNLLASLERFVRTGDGIDQDRSLCEEGWTRYRDAMRALARPAAPIVAQELPLQRAAARMLEIGGPHGLFSMALCEIHPALRSEVLDPSPVEKQVSGRITPRSGEVLRKDLGSGDYDIVVVSGLVHRLSDEQNHALGLRVTRALRPGGVFVIGDVEQARTPGDGGALAGTLDLHLALLGKPGLWPLSQMRRWQIASGLIARPTIRQSRLRGFIVQIGLKPSR